MMHKLVLNPASYLHYCSSLPREYKAIPLSLGHLSNDINKVFAFSKDLSSCYDVASSLKDLDNQVPGNLWKPSKNRLPK